jgi:hypothetical protein
MPPETVKDWVHKIAEAVETWQTMPADSVEVTMVTETPSGAMTHIVNTIPAQYREAVRRRPSDLEHYRLLARSQADS